jgi:hypothetical protein
MPAGGASEVVALAPNTPTTSEPAVVVVRDGAAMRRVFEL